MQNRNARIVPGGIILVAIVGWLAFGYFGVQSLFTDDEVAEAGPSFDSGAGTGVGNALQSDEFDAAMEEAADHQVAVEEDMMPGTIVTVAEGTFAGRNAHSVKGSAVVLNDGTAQRFLRLEDFEATNGPDLKVYLRADDDRYVSLGALKGNIGSQNYEIPPEVDLATYSTVQIWCERFGVLFGDASLA